MVFSGFGFEFSKSFNSVVFLVVLDCRRREIIIKMIIVRICIVFSFELYILNFLFLNIYGIFAREVDCFFYLIGEDIDV